ncbi:MAG: TIGR00159 family protein [Bacteroidales bacterium]|nr:TIGR00159 family protein [Bacteroidales bacterium]
MFDFVHISFIDILDIILVGLLIYELFRLIRGTAAIRIVTGVFTLYVIWMVVQALNMKLLSTILGQVLGVGVIAMIIIFQQEIRRFLFRIGSSYGGGIFSKWRYRKDKSIISSEAIDEITSACRKMSETKTGALIVFVHNSSLAAEIETGDTINAAINRRLIENLFFKNSPLHDGAVIMDPHHIIAARCTLPITEKQDINPKYGMRHKAAIGITEQGDAEVIVVSEETGEISYVAKGVITKMNSIAELNTILGDSYNKI